MHRSSSYYLSSTAASSSSSSSLAAMAGSSGTAAGDEDQLPTYDPQSDAGKKEALDASRANLAHTLVHLVPVVVLLCGLLLWSLSTTTTASSEVGGITRNTVRAKLVPLTKRVSTRTLNMSEMMTGMDGVDPTGKNEVVKRQKRRNLRREM